MGAVSSFLDVFRSFHVAVAPVRFLCVGLCFDWKFTPPIATTVDFFIVRVSFHQKCAPNTWHQAKSGTVAMANATA